MFKGVTRVSQMCYVEFFFGNTAYCRGMDVTCFKKDLRLLEGNFQNFTGSYKFLNNKYQGK